MRIEMTVDPNNLETRKGHCNDSNSSGDNEPFQTKAVYGGEIMVHVCVLIIDLLAASKGRTVSLLPLLSLNPLRLEEGVEVR